MLLRKILLFNIILLLKIIGVISKNSSMTFIIDNTSSMSDVIEQVKDAAITIMQRVNDKTTSLVENVVLVTFNDPDNFNHPPLPCDDSKKSAELRNITNDGYVFRNLVSKIRAVGGGDPQECSLTGLKVGLEKSLPESCIFMFTDNGSKDLSKLGTVKSIAQNKQSQIVIIITSSYCQHSEYTDIADATHGQVFCTGKDNLNDIFNYASECIKGGNTVLKKVTLPPSSPLFPQRFDISVDDRTSYVLISARGENVNLHQVSDIYNNIMDFTRTINYDNSKVIKFYPPKAGVYSVFVSGTTEINIMVYAKTDFTFEYGFFKPEEMPKQLVKQPIAGEKYSLQISVTDPNQDVDIKTVKMLNRRDGIIDEIPLRRLNGDIYTSERGYTVQPDQFTIVVTGQERERSSYIERKSRTAVSPDVHKAPTVTIAEGTTVTVPYGSHKQFTCRVTGNPLPEITWNSKGPEKNNYNNVLMNNETYSTLKVYNVKSDTYTCHAKNNKGKKERSIHVHVESPFVVTHHPEETTRVHYRAPSNIVCEVKSSLPMGIKWFHQTRDIGSEKTEIHTSDKYTISPGGVTLQIRSTVLGLDGKYSCEAFLMYDKNVKISFTTNVEIDNMTPPIFESTRSDSVIKQEKTSITISCKLVRGTPRPVVSWQVQKKGDKEFRDVRTVGEQLKIESASLLDAGQYKCIAENPNGRIEKKTEVIIIKAPEATINEGKTKTVPYGSNNIFTCTIVGYPRPEIAWENSKGNNLKSVETEDPNHLATIISRVQLQHAISTDTYSCFAKNSLDKTVSSIHVEVLSPFTVYEHPDDTTFVHYGKPKDITCNIKAKFPYKIKWFLNYDSSDMSEIYTSGNYTISDDGSKLHINFADIDRIGKYTCEASLDSNRNEKTVFTTNVQIDDMASPIFESNGSNTVTVQEKQRITISCKIIGGTPHPIVSWQVMKKGDKEFRDVRTVGEQLKIENASLVDAGQYKCIAKNPKEQIEKNTEVVVNKPPEATIDEGTTKIVPYGSDNTFTCRIVAHPRPKIAWKNSNGNKLKYIETEDPYHIGTIVSRLLPQHTIAADTYSCFAENSLDKTVSSIHVEVSSPFTVYEHPDDTTFVHYGKSKNIICNIKTKFPYKIKWFLNYGSSEMSEINTSGIYTISDDGSKLHINFADIDRIGKYTCEASLDSDKKEKKVFTTNLQIDDIDHPKIIYFNVPGIIRKNEMFQATCRAEGNPKPIISWKLKKKGSTEYVGIHGQEVLEIPHVEYKDAGSYKCIATNVNGTESRSTEVVVEGAPVITNTGLYYGVTGDKILSIPCNATGVPESTITWWKNGSKITNIGNKREFVEHNLLLIQNPNEEDSGNVTCEATNKLGSDYSTFEAVIWDYPDVEGNSNKTFVPIGGSIDLNCTVPHSDDASVRWYLNGQLSSVHGSVYRLTNVTTINDGNYTCRVNGDQGSQSQNFEVDVGYAPRFMYTNWQEVKNWFGNEEDYIDCEVSAKPLATVEWFYNGEKLEGHSSLRYLTKWGNYTCKMSNVHGEVQRTWNVTNVESCLINKTVESEQKTPLLIGEDSNWSMLKSADKFLIVKNKQTLTLACNTEDQPDNEFKTISAKTIYATCHKEDTFIVDGKEYKFKDLQCKNVVTHSYLNTHVPCIGSEGEMLKAGFNLKNGFLKMYDICVSGGGKQKTLYTKIPMPKNDIGNINAYSLQSNNSCDGKSKCCYADGQFVSAKDIPFGPAQPASFRDEYNVVPVWQPCNRKFTWNKVEDFLRKESTSYEGEPIIVWTGGSHYSADLIPRYLWKVVKLDIDEYDVIVYVNDPEPNDDDILCSEDSPMFINEFSPNDKFTYTCSLEDFTNAMKLNISVFKDD